MFLVLFKEILSEIIFCQYYIAEKQLTHEDVLIKRMRMKLNYFSIEKMEKNLEQELKISNSLKYIVKIMEWFILDDHFYVVMEYCSGGNLEKILRDQKKIPQQVYYK
jgi:serine/threonine protein kinase